MLSSRSQLIELNDALSSAKASGNYVWKVRAGDESDAPSAWSDEATFRYMPVKGEQLFACSQWIGAITRADAKIPEGRKFTGGELRKPEVKAAWEAVDSLAKKSIYLRRPFQTDKKIVKATASVAGLGFYEFTLNGQKIGESEFAPLWSDYDKTVFFNTYDVTQQLQQGDNVAGILLGNGFYNVQGGRYRKLLISFGPPTLLFELKINYADGAEEVICSDADWKYDFSPIVFNCIYGGEDYDARLEQKGWDTSRFNDETWKSVVLQEASNGELRPQMVPPMKIMDRYVVKHQTKLTIEQIESATKTTKRTEATSAFVLVIGPHIADYHDIICRGTIGP